MDVTIKHIAEKLNLSISTVSRALSGSYGVSVKTISRVQEAAKSMGYIPNLGAKQLVGKRSNLIGVFMPEFEFESAPEFVEFFPPLHKALRMFGKDTIIFSVPFSNYPSGRLMEWVGMRNLEGCVLLPAFGKGHPLVKEALALKVPCMNFGGAVGPRCSLIASDDREGGRMAGRLLLSHGHRRIGFIGGPEHVPISNERYAGFCEAYAEAGGTHDPELTAVGDFSGAGGARAATELWKKDRGMTAIFCANDLMAMGAIMALSQEGVRVPDDISVIGYDGSYFTAYTNPPLTTIRHANERIGFRAAEMLVELLNGSTGRKETIAPVLVERQSVSRSQH